MKLSIGLASTLLLALASCGPQKSTNTSSNPTGAGELGNATTPPQAPAKGAAPVKPAPPAQTPPVTPPAPVKPTPPAPVQTNPVQGNQTNPVQGNQTNPVQGSQSNPVQGSQTPPVQKGGQSPSDEAAAMIAQDGQDGFLQIMDTRISAVESAVAKNAKLSDLEDQVQALRSEYDTLKAETDAKAFQDQAGTLLGNLETLEAQVQAALPSSISR